MRKSKNQKIKIPKTDTLLQRNKAYYNNRRSKKKISNKKENL